MKKILVLLLAAVMVLSCAGLTAAEEEVPDRKDIDEYLWEITDDMSDEEFSKYAARNYKIIKSVSPIVDEKSYAVLDTAYGRFTRGREGSIDAMKEALAGIALTDTVKDNVIFIWDKNNIPYVEETLPTEEELDANVQDGAGFVPMIFKFLIDDPSKAKGNIIVASGGGFTYRGNNGEGYDCCRAFNELGYNTFLLEYRLSPYDQKDAFLDMQRAIRVVKFYAENEGWGGQDLFAAVGFSAGGMTVCGAVWDCEYDKDPSEEGAVSYIPDNIDTISGKLDAILPVYGINAELINEKEDIPLVYMCVGSEDGMCEDVKAAYELLKDKTTCRLDVIEGAKHGFGTGAAKSTPDGCREWPKWADEFLQNK